MSLPESFMLWPCQYLLSHTHHTRVQMWQRTKWDIQERIGIETKTGNKWQQARNFNTRYKIVLEILTCLPLIPGPTHLPRITSTISISLIHYELILHWHRSKTSQCQSWNTVWTTIRLTPNLKSPQYEGTNVSTTYVLHISLCQLHTVQEQFFCVIHITCNASEILHAKTNADTTK